MLFVPGQYWNLTLMLSYSVNWISMVVPIGTIFTNPCSHILVIIILQAVVLQKTLYICIPSLAVPILSVL